VDPRSTAGRVAKGPVVANRVWWHRGQIVIGHWAPATRGLSKVLGGAAGGATGVAWKGGPGGMTGTGGTGNGAEGAG